MAEKSFNVLFQDYIRIQASRMQVISKPWRLPPQVGLWIDKAIPRMNVPEKCSHHPIASSLAVWAYSILGSDASAEKIVITVCRSPCPASAFCQRVPQ